MERGEEGARNAKLQPLASATWVSLWTTTATPWTRSASSLSWPWSRRATMPSWPRTSGRSTTWLASCRTAFRCALASTTWPSPGPATLGAPTTNALQSAIRNAPVLSHPDQACDLVLRTWRTRCRMCSTPPTHAPAIPDEPAPSPTVAATVPVPFDQAPAPHVSVVTRSRP